jgi:REP element-mobilizing transposase RayT
MAQSLSSVLIHLIFSTKHREPFITPAIETELHPYMATIFRALKSPSLAINSRTDHIHILFALGRVIAIADLVEEIKTESSKWIKTKGPRFRNFHWQSGYGHSPSDSRKFRQSSDPSLARKSTTDVSRFKKSIASF